jgi:hypothetical protein
MSNNQDWFDDDEFDFEEDEVTTSRSSDDVLKKVRRAERAKDKQLKEALAELEQLRRFQRDANVSKVLSEKGINPKIAAFIPTDIEPTEIAVGSWLEQYGDVFGVASEVAQESNVNAQALNTFQQINDATSNAMSPDGINDMFSALNNAQSEDELLNLIYGA